MMHLPDLEFHNVQQNSEEWYQARLGKITASNFAKIMAYHDKPKLTWGKGALDYARKKALERVTGELDPTASFKNAFMDRGHELEPVAIERYEFETFYEVKDGGFITSGNFGDSPDSVVGNVGRIEIKSVAQKAHWERLEKGGIDSAYYWQVQGHLLFGAEWCDFISFCPEFPEAKQIYIHRVYPNEADQVKLMNRLTLFDKLISDYEKFLTS